VVGCNGPNDILDISAKDYTWFKPLGNIPFVEIWGEDLLTVEEFSNNETLFTLISEIHPRIFIETSDLVQGMLLG